MHEPVGRVQFGVFEKFTGAYLFQIAREKSCDYLLIICMKTFPDGQEKLGHKLRHPGLALDLKTKDFLTKPYCSLANHNPEFRCVSCTVYTHFALVLHILHSFLSQSELNNFFVYTISFLTILIRVAMRMMKLFFRELCERLFSENWTECERFLGTN